MSNCLRVATAAAAAPYRQRRGLRVGAIVARVAAVAAIVTPAGAQSVRGTTGGFEDGGSRVTVPFELQHGLVIIPVSVNGSRPLRMILDTGSPVLVIPDTALAARLGLQSVGQAQVSGTGDGPPVMAGVAVDVGVAVGALKVGGAMAIIGAAREAAVGLDGIIGGPLLMHSAARIDWMRQEVTFMDPATVAPSASATVLPLDVTPSLHTYITGTLTPRAGAEGVPLRLHLDTGARQAVGVAAGASPLLSQIQPRLHNVVTGWGSRGAARGDAWRAAQLTLGTHQLRDIVVTERAIPDDATTQGWVGTPLLQRFITTIDYGGGRLILEPIPGDHPPFEFSTTGIVLAPPRPGATAFLVADVLPDSPAARAGLAVGDRIERVGAVPVADLTAAEIGARLLTPAAGTVVRLVVTNGAGERTSHTLTARRVI